MQKLHLFPLLTNNPMIKKVSNFKLVSVLNTFSKIYESAIKNQLNSVLNNIFSPYLAGYRGSYSTQHVLIKLLEEYKDNLDNNYTVGEY